jgi:ureidoacrylate peracid hydrolase
LPLAGVEAAVRHTADVIERTKQPGDPVIFTRHVYRPGRADEGANLSGKRSGVAEIDGLAAGSWDGTVVDDLGWTDRDLTVDKARFDAFLWTSLDPLLRGRCSQRSRSPTADPGLVVAGTPPGLLR